MCIPFYFGLQRRVDQRTVAAAEQSWLRIAAAMAQVVVSYASEDRPIVRQFVDELERRGLTVWWDRRLLPGQRYRQRIQEEIGRAVCVIVVWSRSSISNMWVSSEASLALEPPKLIPVCTKDVSFGNVPLPFGELH